MKHSNETTLLQKIQKHEVLIHLIFWLIYLLFPFLKTIGRAYPYHFYSELSDFIFEALIFYIAYIFLFPSEQKWSKNILFFIVFCLIAYLNFRVHNWLFGGSHQEIFLYYGISYASTYAILILFAYVLYSTKLAYRKEEDLKVANQEKQQAELLSLKSQINPHFLFNTLNTIYLSALKKEDKAPEMILKLSDNFRYLLQEGQKDFVTVQQEIAHLRGYISLQKERHFDKISIDFTADIDDNQQQIAPLLLISFVENAFKYTSLLRDSRHPINVHISLIKGYFKFYCKNPFENKTKWSMDNNWKESGIGIMNTKKRLIHLYPNKHQLKIRRDNNVFEVLLNIQLC